MVNQGRFLSSQERGASKIFCLYLHAYPHLLGINKKLFFIQTSNILYILSKRITYVSIL